MQRFKRPENTKEIKEQLEIVPVEEIKDVLENAYKVELK